MPEKLFVPFTQAEIMAADRDQDVNLIFPFLLSLRQNFYYLINMRAFFVALLFLTDLVISADYTEHVSLLKCVQLCRQSQMRHIHKHDACQSI